MTTQAWEDFAAFTATGGNVQQRPAGERGDVLTPAEVGAVFDDLRLQFAAGGRAALWAGIRAACLYNVPMPYWLADALLQVCLLYTSPSPRDRTRSRMPSSA